MRISLLPILLFALPLLEIAGFVVVGSRIGVLATIGLVLLSGVAGMVMMRVQGFGVMRRLRQEMEAGGKPGRELAHGAMILLAGLLLVIPGFVTDIIGLLLFIPPIREAAWRFLRTRAGVVTRFGMGGRGFAGARGRTIDLDDDDFSSGPKPNSPWRPIDGD